MSFGSTLGVQRRSRRDVSPTRRNRWDKPSHCRYLPYCAVIEEAHQGPGTAHEGVKNLFHRLVHSYHWPGMKKSVQLQLQTSTTCDNFQNTSKRLRAKINPIPTNDRGDILPIDCGKSFTSGNTLREQIYPDNERSVYQSRRRGTHA